MLGTPALAKAPPIAAIHIAKIKAIYLPIRTLDKKAYALLRTAIINSETPDIAAANEAIFLTAARALNSARKVFQYTYGNKIQDDADVKLVHTCFISFDIKYQEIIQLIFDGEVYFLDAVDDEDAIDDIFSGHTIQSQAESCGAMEKALGIA